MERRNNENVETTANETIGILETLTESANKARRCSTIKH